MKTRPSIQTSIFQPALFRACIARSRSQNHVRTLYFQCFRTGSHKERESASCNPSDQVNAATSKGRQPHHSDRLRTNHPREPKLNPRSPDAPRKTDERRLTEAHA